MKKRKTLIVEGKNKWNWGKRSECVQSKATRGGGHKTPSTIFALSKKTKSKGRDYLDERKKCAKATTLQIKRRGKKNHTKADLQPAVKF